jgi:surface antigen
MPAPPPSAPRQSQKQSATYRGPPGFPAPVIVTPAKPLQCVPYARRLSNIQIRGDAWTWWRSASGRYRRGRKPAVGAVLALSRQGRSLGHLAVVTQIVNDREIIVSHANWLNQGRIHLNNPVTDVSFWGNWSAVRVWYAPGGHCGGRAYKSHGFIYPAVTTAARRTGPS